MVIRFRAGNAGLGWIGACPAIPGAGLGTPWNRRRTQLEPFLEGGGAQVDSEHGRVEWAVFIPCVCIYIPDVSGGALGG